ncbi:MAG: hypothetical protein JNL21_16970 [Myxococcales bacterium]|nr:hypothetical protein [Myxococcales bacterium]
MPRLALAATLLVPLGALLVGACNAEFCDIVECTSAQGGQGGGGAGGSTSTSTGEGGTIDPGCIPSMLPAGAAVPATCGVFVDADANGTGTQADPLKRLDDAIALAETPDKPSVIYVCGAPELAGSFEMKGGTSLFGGLDCGTWTYDPANRPKIVGMANAPALAVRDDGQSFLADIDIDAAPGQGEGQSSIGLLVHLASVTVDRVSVSASDGSEGAEGEPPMTFSTPAQSGALQNCPNMQGANPGTNMCEGTPTSGGNGGAVSNPIGLAGAPGSPPAIGGDGGLSVMDCNAGGQGQPGDSPGPAVSMSALDEFDLGTLSSSGFTVSVAPDGIAGAPGGGGGGGRGGPVRCGGGGGGAGGCGGAGGGGGQSGGASLAIAVLDGVLTLGSGVKLATGSGGTGGNGVAGANGQQGGAGSIFMPMMPSDLDGCPGGAGGTGGAGSGGAGGNGGLSALIFLQGSATSTGEPETPMIGMGGTFGLGGDGMAPNGSDGAECRLFHAGAMDPCEM